jgi:hypothetical protein
VRRCLIAQRTRPAGKAPYRYRKQPKRPQTHSQLFDSTQRTAQPYNIAGVTGPDVLVELDGYCAGRCTNGPDGDRTFSSQLHFFLFVADHKVFALAQRVLNVLSTDFDFQHLSAVR